MAFASDPHLDPDKLSMASRRLLELRDAVLMEWKKRLLASVIESRPLLHPVLINTIPVLIGNIAEALSPDYPRTSAEVGAPSVASEHGGERARLTHYNLQAVITEYQVLRLTLFDVLKKNGVQLSEAEVLVMNSSLDADIKEAVNAFVLVQSAFRENFVASLAHDLRNPLASIHAAAELILHTTDSQKIKTLAGQVVENARRMDRMIQDLLDTLIFQSGERLRLDLSTFDMLEAVKEVREQSMATHGDRFEISGNAVRGWWGRDAIKRALENLVGNAVKYGTPGGPIRIRVDSAYERVIITVHNEGNPIPPEQIETIFQVFRRTQAAKEGNKQGWGIGLPYVRSVAESHGGSIGVDSSAERGTTFTIDIPVDARPFQDAPTLEKAR